MVLGRACSVGLRGGGGAGACTRGVRGSDGQCWRGGASGEEARSRTSAHSCSWPRACVTSAVRHTTCPAHRCAWSSMPWLSTITSVCAASWSMDPMASGRAARLLHAGKGGTDGGSLLSPGGKGAANAVSSAQMERAMSWSHIHTSPTPHHWGRRLHHAGGSAPAGIHKVQAPKGELAHQPRVHQHVDS